MRALPLQRGDVHDGARVLFDQARQDGPVQADGGEQVGTEGLQPVVVGERERPAGPGEGCPDAMHDGIEAAEDLDRLTGDEVRAFGGGQVGQDQPGRGPVVWMTCGRDNARLLGAEQFRDGCAHAARSAGDQDFLAVEGLGIRAARKRCRHRTIPFYRDEDSVGPPFPGRSRTTERANPLPGGRTGAKPLALTPVALPSPEPPFDSPQWPESQLTTDPVGMFGPPASRSSASASCSPPRTDRSPSGASAVGSPCPAARHYLTRRRRHRSCVCFMGHLHVLYA